MDKAITPTQTIPLSTIAKRRMRTSREEMATLDEFYRKNPNPNQEEKKEIAKIVHMGPKNVHFWFQNRRAKDNRKKKGLLQQSGQSKVQQPSSSSSRSKEHLLRSSTNINNAGKRPLDNPATEALQLPPICDLIITPVRDLDIPFYFYHSKFGIEESLVQWTKGRENKPSN